MVARRARLRVLLRLDWDRLPGSLGGGASYLLPKG